MPNEDVVAPDDDDDDDNDDDDDDDDDDDKDDGKDDDVENDDDDNVDEEEDDDADKDHHNEDDDDANPVDGHQVADVQCLPPLKTPTGSHTTILPPYYLCPPYHTSKPPYYFPLTSAPQSNETGFWWKAELLSDRQTSGNVTGGPCLCFDNHHHLYFSDSLNHIYLRL